QISRLLRSVPFTAVQRDAFIDRITATVQELRHVEKEMAKLQRRIEQHGEQGRDDRKELRSLQQRAFQMEEKAEATSSELRRTLTVIQRGQEEDDIAKRE